MREKLTGCSSPDSRGTETLSKMDFVSGDPRSPESNYSAGGKAELIPPAYRLRPACGGKAELRP